MGLFTLVFHCWFWPGSLPDYCGYGSSFDGISSKFPTADNSVLRDDRIQCLSRQHFHCQKRRKCCTNSRKTHILLYHIRPHCLLSNAVSRRTQWPLDSSVSSCWTVFLRLSYSICPSVQKKAKNWKMQIVEGNCEGLLD